ALLGGVGVGVYPSMAAAAAAAVRVEREFAPSPDGAALDELYDVYRAAYQALKPVHAALAQTRN
ncbi:hypothetical protein, partial [Catellatospora methionotrophica]